MKKTILLSSLFAVGAAFATTVESGNAVGALDKQISTSDATQILISVPFIGYENGGAVKVEDMVKTSDLAQNSKLYVPNGTAGGYDTWTLDSDGKWVADKKVTISATGTSEGVSLDQNTATANRGDSFWLEPKFKNEAPSGTIFLLGQGVADDGQSTADAGCWNLIGNASLKSVQLKTLKGTKGDQIIVQVGGKLRYYSYNREMWTYQDPTTGERVTDDNVEIKPGQGLWYKNASNEDLPINWANFVPKSGANS